MYKIDVVKSKFLQGSFDQNTYVISNEKFAVIIDAGAEVDDILKITQKKRVLAVLITHLHFDHIWNLETILSKFGCDVFIKKDFDDFFGDSFKNVSAEFFLNKKFNILKSRVKYYEKTLKFEDFEFEIFDTPGHSKDSVCLKFDKNLFTGDVVFHGAVGRTDLYSSSENELLKSLELVKNIEFELAYPGHGEECDKNEILRTIEYYL